LLASTIFERRQKKVVFISNFFNNNMKKKYFASVYKGSRQSKYRPEDNFVRRLAGKAYGQQIKGLFNQRTFARGLPAGQAGFTLIELLVVIGIIAILAAVVIVAVNPAHQFALARDTQRSANVATILDAVDENMAEHKGVFTCNGAAFVIDGPNPNPTPIMSGSANGGDLAPCLVPDYVSSLPYDPTSGSYTSTSSYDTGYQIGKDYSGHIMVFGYSELLPNNGLIRVTR
jgi:prepilin-type N-terminal cleavage/methylation domain-containing protein